MPTRTWKEPLPQMLVGLADCCYRGGAASWPQKLSRLTEMSRWPEIQKFTFSWFDFFLVQIPKSKSKSRKLTFVESYQLIDHAKQMEVVDRAHHWNHSSWNPWFRDSLQMIQTLVPTAVRFSVWCFRERVSLLGIPKFCPSSTIFVSAASLHH